MMEQNQTALIAMSGGVDSSVAAYLMKQRGFQCKGITMRLYRNADLGLSAYHPCCSQQDIDDASDVAFQLDIPYEVLDFTSDFKEKIIEKFIRIYECGGTPNPCIDCNRFMKFEHLVRYADREGFNYVVTGHYARIEKDSDSGRYLLKKALDLSKDQSYVLYMLSQAQLSRILFPLGSIKKSETRKIAGEQGFCNSRKHDSQDICFVPDGDYVAFMERYCGKKYTEGDFLDENGHVVGKHSGAVRYTIGQRKGLGLAFGTPRYVFDKNMVQNTVSIGPEDHLFHQALMADDANWIAFDQLKEPIHCKAKTRYRQEERAATVYPADNGQFKVVFDAPERAIAIGQAVVLYDEDVVLGGGTISRVL